MFHRDDLSDIMKLDSLKHKDALGCDHLLNSFETKSAKIELHLLQRENSNKFCHDF